MAKTPLKNGHDFFQRMLAQGAEAEDRVTLVTQLVVEDKLPEDTWLDYKDGRYLDKLDKAELRRDITAFANSGGGCLVIGVSEKKEPDSCLSKPGDFAPFTGDVGRVRSQLEGVVQHLVGQVLPPPRPPMYLSIGGGTVVVIAIPRSGRLAAVNENGALAYYIRVVEGRAKVPDYLIADLMFGRREQPDLEAQVVELGKAEEPACLRFVFHVQVENRGFTTAAGLHCGAATWQGSSHGFRGAAPGRRLRELIEWGPKPRDMEAWTLPLELISPEGRVVTTLPPFAIAKTTVEVRVPKVARIGFELSVDAALWIGSERSPPRWWQLHCNLGGGKTCDECFGSLPRVSVVSD